MTPEQRANEVRGHFGAHWDDDWKDELEAMIAAAIRDHAAELTAENARLRDQIAGHRDRPTVDDMVREYTASLGDPP